MDYYTLDEQAKAHQREIEQWAARNRLVSQAASSQDRGARGLRSTILLLASSISLTAAYLLLGW
jgi:hypothetical protein